MLKSIWYEFDQWPHSFDEQDDNADVIFELEDGTRWAATFFTYKNIDTLRKKNQLTGEYLAGGYFCSTDMILISSLRKDEIQKVIYDLILHDEVSLYCQKI